MLLINPEPPRRNLTSDSKRTPRSVCNLLCLHGSDVGPPRPLEKKRVQVSSPADGNEIRLLQISKEDVDIFDFLFDERLQVILLRNLDLQEDGSQMLVNGSRGVVVNFVCATDTMTWLRQMSASVNVSAKARQVMPISRFRSLDYLCILWCSSLARRYPPCA
jgi:hypothetical protein